MNILRRQTMTESLHQLRRSVLEQEKYNAFDEYTKSVRDLVIVQR